MMSVIVLRRFLCTSTTKSDHSGPLRFLKLSTEERPLDPSKLGPIFGILTHLLHSFLLLPPAQKANRLFYLLPSSFLIYHEVLVDSRCPSSIMCFCVRRGTPRGTYKFVDHFLCESSQILQSHIVTKIHLCTNLTAVLLLTRTCFRYFRNLILSTSVVRRYN
jgi:hypothetical protein